MSGDAVRISCENKKEALLWMINWATAISDRQESNYGLKEFIQLLQYAGCTLQKLEVTSNVLPTNGLLKLNLTCEQIGVMATMTYEPSTRCSCSSLDELKSLVTNKSHAVMADLLKEFVYMINIIDENKNIVENSNWEVDPNTTPPRDCSTPLVLGNYNKATAVEQNLKQIKHLVTSTLELFTSFSKNATFTKESNEIRTVKRVSDIKKEVPAIQQDQSICSTANIVNRPATPVSTAYKKIQSKVSTFRTKPSPVTTTTATVKKTEKSKIPSIAFQRVGSINKADGVIKTKVSVMKK